MLHSKSYPEISLYDKNRVKTEWEGLKEQKGPTEILDAVKRQSDRSLNQKKTTTYMLPYRLRTIKLNIYWPIVKSSQKESGECTENKI